MPLSRTLAMALLFGCEARDPACDDPVDCPSTPALDQNVEPGGFKAPLVELARVHGGEGAVGGAGSRDDNLHMEELRYRRTDGLLFYCSSTFGVIDADDPRDPHHLAQGYGWALPSNGSGVTGCVHLDWDDEAPDIVYVSHRGNADFQAHLSVVDLGSHVPDPAEPDVTALAPRLGDPLQEPGVSYEGLDAANGKVYVALHEGGIGVYERGSDLRLVRIGGDDTLVPDAYDLEVVGNLAYVLDEQAGLFILDVTDVDAIHEVGRLFLGGIDRDLRVDGDFAYIAAGAGGLMIVDVSDPTRPTLVSQTPTHGTAVRVGLHEDLVSVAVWNDTRVYDVRDRTAPTLVGAARLEQAQDTPDDEDRPAITSRVLGTDLFEDTLFVGDWRVPYTFAIHADRVAPYLVLPEQASYMGIGTVKVGTTGTYDLRVANHGTADLTLHDVGADHAGFEVAPTEARIAPGGEQTFTITYTAADSTEQHTVVRWSSDDPTYPERLGYAVANAVGVGVGDPFPHTEASSVETLASWSSDQLAGRVGLVAYFATFCPVCSIQLPDIEDRLHRPYGPEGLVVVALDPDPDDYQRPDAVATYAEQLGVSFPVAFEESGVTPTYLTIRDVYRGESPYPLDILIDRDGIIRYIAREYDPEALEAMVVELLAEAPDPSRAHRTPR